MSWMQSQSGQGSAIPGNNVAAMMSSPFSRGLWLAILAQMLGLPNPTSGAPGLPSGAGLAAASGGNPPNMTPGVMSAPGTPSLPPLAGMASTLVPPGTNPAPAPPVAPTPAPAPASAPLSTLLQYLQPPQQREIIGGRQ